MKPFRYYFIYCMLFYGDFKCKLMGVATWVLIGAVILWLQEVTFAILKSIGK